MPREPRDRKDTCLWGCDLARGVFCPYGQWLATWVREAYVNLDPTSAMLRGEILRAHFGQSS